MARINTEVVPKLSLGCRDEHVYDTSLQQNKIAQAGFPKPQPIGRCSSPCLCADNWKTQFHTDLHELPTETGPIQ